MVVAPPELTDVIVDALRTRPFPVRAILQKAQHDLAENRRYGCRRNVAYGPGVTAIRRTDALIAPATAVCS